MIRLTQRKKLIVVALMTFVAVSALLTLAVKPAIDRIETLNRIIPEKQDELLKLRAKSNEYVFLRNGLNDLHAKVASQEKGFELLPFLESLIRECGLTKKAATMKQQVLELGPGYYETIVEIRLENLSLEQLVDFLGKVESSKVLVRIKTLYIKKNLANADLLDSVVEIHNAKLTQS